MSAISGFINSIRTAVYGEQVRGAIVSALEQCYSDVSNPSLNTAAFSAAIEAAYANGFLDIQEKSTIAGMTNTKIIYRYTGNAAGYVHNALYYYDGTAWRPIGSGIQTASTAAQMTDTNAIYKYTGSEAGYIKGAIYYYDGSSWVPIGKAQTPSTETLISTAFELGSLNNAGSPVDSNTRVRSQDYIQTDGKIIEIIFPSGIYGYVFEYTSSNTFIKESGNSTTGSLRYKTTGAKIKLVLRNEAGDDSITVADCNALKLYVLDNVSTSNYTIKATVERGAIQDVGTNIGFPLCDIAFLYRQRSAFFIKVNNASTMTFEEIYTKGFSNITVYFYSESMRVLSHVSSQGRNVTIPNNAEFIKFVITCDSELQNTTITFSGATEEPTEEKNVLPTQSTSYPVNYKVGDYQNYVNMLLPPNYDPDGAPVPLVIFGHGSGHLKTWGGTMTNLDYLKFIRDSGFAVAEFYSWTTKYFNMYGTTLDGIDPYVLPITLKAYEDGVNWLCSRFNIDINNIHIMSKSQGGHIAYYYANYAPFPIRSIGMFSPVLDPLSMAQTNVSVGKAIAQELNLVGDIDNDFAGKSNFSEEKIAIWQDNLPALNCHDEAFQGLIGQTLQEKFDTAIDNGSKWWANKSRDDVYIDYDLAKLGKYPVKIWGTPTDAETPYQKMVEAVKQLNNGGCEAHLRTFAAGGHNVTDVGANAAGEVQTNVTTRLGVEFASVPTAYVENLDWILLHMNEVDDN